MSDLKTVLRDIGGLLIIVGLISLVAILAPIYFSELYGIFAILITSAVFIGVGIPLYLIFKKPERSDFKSAMVTAALGWMFVSLIGSIPFMIMGFNKNDPLVTMDFLSAFFESMSGWTGLLQQEGFL